MTESGTLTQGAQTNAVSDEPFTSLHQCSVPDEYFTFEFLKKQVFLY